MNIEILENSGELRKSFIDRYVLTWNDFQVEYKEFIDEMSSKNQVVDIDFYNRSYLWDRISPKYPRVSFKEALDLLSNVDGDVFFMSEDENVPCSAELLYGEDEIRSFVAKASAKELAELIEKEWFEAYKFMERDLFVTDQILPEDLYVFDSSMRWFVIFTHETTDWQTEDLMKEAESRYCIIFPGK